MEDTTRDVRTVSYIPLSASHRFNHQFPRFPNREVRYTQLLKTHSEESISPVDRLSFPGAKAIQLVDSPVLNSWWTADEKERFFTALARCGRGNLLEISRRVATRSLAEVTAYVGLLDEETKIWKLSSKKRRVFDFAKVPAAIEVDDQWIAIEEKLAVNFARKSDKGDPNGSMDNEITVLNIEGANELARWYQNMLAPSKTPMKLTSTTIENLDSIIQILTRRLLRTVFFLVLSNARNGQEKSIVTVSDVRTAIDLLSLPRRFATHFTTLPRRMHEMGVKIIGSKTNYYKQFGMKGKEKVTDPDTVEAILSARPARSKARSNTRHPWPEEWDINYGFNWESQFMEENPIYGHSSDDEGELPDGFKDVEIAEMPDELGGTSPPPSSPALSVDSERAGDTNDEEDGFLHAEMLYIDALDARLSQMEQNRLNDYIEHGESCSRKNHKQALKTFYNDIDDSRKPWRALKSRFTAEFGFSWAEYSSEDDIGSSESEWDAPQEWELFQKQTPSLKATRMLRKRKYNTDSVKSNKRIKSNETIESEDLEATDSEYEDV